MPIPDSLRGRADEVALNRATSRMKARSPMKEEEEDLDDVAEECVCPQCGYKGMKEEFMPSDAAEGDEHEDY